MGFLSEDGQGDSQDLLTSETDLGIKSQALLLDKLHQRPHSPLRWTILALCIVFIMGPYYAFGEYWYPCACLACPRPLPDKARTRADKSSERGVVVQELMGTSIIVTIRCTQTHIDGCKDARIFLFRRQSSRNSSRASTILWRAAAVRFKLYSCPTECLSGV